ncbi:MAG TPA: NAD(P)H-hydrate dehydratase [Brevundimonas sp.]|nr:NAD(P)H-hydrate dehydratase [Brevundimonas sp.]
MDLTPELLRTLPLPRLRPDGDKNDRGVCLVVAGGGGVPGAALLSGRAALRVGAGRLRLAAPRPLAAAFGVALPEARIVAAPAAGSGEFSRRAARTLAPLLEAGVSVVIGPGMMDAPAAQRLALDLLATDGAVPFVVDAAALPGAEMQEAFTALARGRVVLTPHAGEMAAMSGCAKEEVLADPLGLARQTAVGLKSVVIMKGAVTFVVSPDGTAWRHAGGVPGLGTSGSGDVLAGVIGGLLARGAAPAVAALWAVYLHAAAGERLSREIGAAGFLASELLDALPRVLQGTAGS